MPPVNPKNVLPVPAIALVWFMALASSFGVAVFSPFNGVAHEMNHSADHSPGESVHTHKMVAVPAGQPVPGVKLVVHPDAMNGWNLELKVTNFAFAPDRVNTKSTSVNEGHAHLYIDGKKVSRLYGPWHHLPSLSPGTHTIAVTLNTNDHGELMYKGQPIQAVQTIQVPEKK